jgi:hypothetical protein
VLALALDKTDPTDAAALAVEKALERMSARSKQNVLCSLATLVRTGGTVLMNGERRRG